MPNGAPIRAQRRDTSVLLNEMSGRVRSVFDNVRAKRANRDDTLRMVSDLQTTLEELRATEDELHASRLQREAERARYFELFDAAPDCYFVTDLYGAIHEANRAAVAMLNIPERHVRYLFRKPLVVYIHHDDRPKFYAAISGLQNEERWSSSLRMLPRGVREPVVTAVVATLARDPSGGRSTIRWAMRDETVQFHDHKLLNEHRQRLRELTSELSMAEERERQRIATGIHDRISQSLAVAKMLLGAVRKRATPEQLEPLNELRGVLEQVIEESRTLTFELSPPMLYQLGLGPAVASLAEQVRRRHKINVVVTDEIDTPETVPINLRVLLFQAIRELLVNVVKHAHAKRVDVTMWIDARDAGRSLRVEVKDNGQGYNARQVPVPSRGGFGIFNIQTRFEQIGAVFKLHSKPGKGTRAIMVVHLSLPAASANVDRNGQHQQDGGI